MNQRQKQCFCPFPTAVRAGGIVGGSKRWYIPRVSGDRAFRSPGLGQARPFGRWPNWGHRNGPSFGPHLGAPGQAQPLSDDYIWYGELIGRALDLGCNHLVIGIGGSATNDGGMGMAQALGVRFLDGEGKELGSGGGELARLASIDVSGLDPRLAAVTIEVACDVDNPLTGPTGASHIYGPQKGATPEMVAQLDAALGNYAEVIRKDLGRDVETVPGAGAAGGLGAGLMALLGEARLRDSARP